MKVSFLIVASICVHLIEGKSPFKHPQDCQKAYIHDGKKYSSPVEHYV